MDSNFIINHEKLGTINVHYITEDGTAEIEKLKLCKVLGWDSETTYAIGHESNGAAGLDPYLSRIRLSQFATESGDVYLFDHFSITSETENGIKDLLESVASVKIAHNAKFDVKMARHHLDVRRMGKLFCTEIGYRLNECGTYEAGKVSLNNAVYTYLKFTLEKELQKSNWSGELTREQLTYAAIDASVLIPLRKSLIKQFTELGITYAAKLDFESIDPIASLELTGFPIDVDKWIAVDASIQEKRIALIERINDELRETVVAQQGLFAGAPLESNTSSKLRFKKLKKPSLAIASSTKVGQFLEAYGVTLPTKINRKTRKKSKTTGTPFLKPMKNLFKIIPKILEFRELEKRATSYGAVYVEKFVHPITGRIHVEFDPQGTKTARYSCNKPNLQQIPKLKEYRSCFVAPEGWKFVGGDFSQIELRIAAELSDEIGYISAFLSGEDFHDGTTVVMFGLNPPPFPKDTPERDAWDKTEEGELFSKMRGYAKNINFGIIYGMGAGKLALSTGLYENKDTLRLYLLERDGLIKIEGIVKSAQEYVKEAMAEGLKPWEILAPLKELSTPEIEKEVEETNTAQDYLDKYYEKFPDLMQWLKIQGNTAGNTHQIRMASGRLVKFFVNEKEKWSVAQAQRNGMNTPVQGLAGEILKIALRSLFNEIYERNLQDVIKLTHTVHDEIQLLATDEFAETAKELLQRNMIEAGRVFLKKVPVAVDVKIGQMWTK